MSLMVTKARAFRKGRASAGALEPKPLVWLWGHRVVLWFSQFNLGI